MVRDSYWLEHFLLFSVDGLGTDVGAVTGLNA